MGNDMYARGVEDALLLALEEARMVWENEGWRKGSREAKRTIRNGTR